MDLIKDRLAHILRAKNLTATQFAEMMQIQPSNVSHLLSGRNKPSLDFLIKLKALFPEYSFDWIILGKKPITNSEYNLKQDNNLFEQFDDIQYTDHNLNEKQDSLLTDNIIPNDVNNTDNNNTIVSNLIDNDLHKRLIQIIYVYDDSTFEVLNKRK